jgi:single-stranded-DNA-specific exonuclease
MGFSIAPRLNAAGRLDDMTIGIECLLSRSITDAYSLAEMLDEINRERRSIQSKDKAQAAQALESSQLPENRASICLFSSEWHQGVVGLVASGLKELHHKPAIIFAKVDADTLKGSARSIDGLHIKHLLDGIAGEHPDVLYKYGGHAMAAGMTLHPKDFEQFDTAFEQAVQAQLTDEQRVAVLLSDGELNAEELHLSFAARLENAGPWGNGFAQPMFDGVFRFCEQSVVGQKHLRLSLEHLGTGKRIAAIAFNQETLNAQSGDNVKIVYELTVNRFRGLESLQLLIRQIEIIN